VYNNIFFLNRLPEANLNPDEASEGQDNNNQTGDLYHYVSYIFFDGCIWQLDSQKKYPARRDFVPHNDSWINTLKKMLVAEHGNNPFNTNFLAVMKNPKFELKSKYNVIQRFDRTIANRLGTGSTRDAAEVLSQLHLNRVRTLLIAYLRNMVNADLGELASQFLEEYGPGPEEAPQSTQDIRGKGHHKTTGGTRGGKVAAQPSKRGEGESQSEGVSTRASKKRQCSTEEQRKQRVKTRYPLRK
jgi:hypothetical protein